MATVAAEHGRRCFRHQADRSSRICRKTACFSLSARAVCCLPEKLRPPWTLLLQGHETGKALLLQDAPKGAKVVRYLEATPPLQAFGCKELRLSCPCWCRMQRWCGPYRASWRTSGSPWRLTGRRSARSAAAWCPPLCAAPAGCSTRSSRCLHHCNPAIYQGVYFTTDICR